MGLSVKLALLLLRSEDADDKDGEEEGELLMGLEYISCDFG
jgi:hypothetical protein